MNRKKRVYLAGPMTGYEQFNFPAFDEAKAMLEAHHGFQVVSPADLDRLAGFTGSGEIPEYLTKDFCMLNDLRFIISCDALVFMPGWEKSKGAQVELAWGRYLGKQILYLDLRTLYLHESNPYEEVA